MTEIIELIESYTPVITSALAAIVTIYVSIKKVIDATSTNVSKINSIKEEVESILNSNQMSAETAQKLQDLYTTQNEALQSEIAALIQDNTELRAQNEELKQISSELKKVKKQLEVVAKA